MNIDHNEVAKFNDIASAWWNTSGPLKTLHEINPLRLSFMQETVNFKEKKVLDVGCGGGILAESMAYLGAQVTGIDLSNSAITVAQQHAASNSNSLNINYQVITVEELALQQAGTYDVVSCMELLEHVPNPASIITACAQLAKPGASLFFSTINRNPKAYLFAVLGAEYFLKLLPKGTHDYNKFITPAEFAKAARAANLKINEFRGMEYHPLKKTYKLTDNISVNYLIRCTNA